MLMFEKDYWVAHSFFETTNQSERRTKIRSSVMIGRQFKNVKILLAELTHTVTKPCNIPNFSVAVKDVLIQLSLEHIQVL